MISVRSLGSGSVDDGMKALTALDSSLVVLYVMRIELAGPNCLVPSNPVERSDVPCMGHCGSCCEGS